MINGNNRPQTLLVTVLLRGDNTDNNSGNDTDNNTYNTILYHVSWPWS